MARFGMPLADDKARVLGKYDGLVGGHMSIGAEAFFSMEHRGCNIRLASYEVCPQTWIPEACVSLSTDLGSRKLWVRSFAHCFASEHVTFTNRTEADYWAVSAAHAIIDKALPEFTAAAQPGIEVTADAVSPDSRTAHLPNRIIDRFWHLLRRS